LIEHQRKNKIKLEFVLKPNKIIIDRLERVKKKHMLAGLQISKYRELLDNFPNHYIENDQIIIKHDKLYSCLISDEPSKICNEINQEIHSGIIINYFKHFKIKIGTLREADDWRDKFWDSALTFNYQCFLTNWGDFRYKLINC
jgi:hypothetical protein